MSNKDKVMIDEGLTQERVKKMTIPYSEEAKANLKEQQKRYMRKHGEPIRLDYLAGMLLETAKYQK